MPAPAVLAALATTPGARLLRLLGVASASLVAAATLSSCKRCTTTGQAPIPFYDGALSDDGLTYQSTPLGESFLHFPPGRRFDLYHGMAAPPSQIVPYVSFDPQLNSQSSDGVPNSDNVSVSSGNQTVIECWDADRIRIRNDTCAEFYVLVVATATPSLTSEFPPCTD